MEADLDKSNHETKNKEDLEDTATPVKNSNDLEEKNEKKTLITLIIILIIYIIIIIGVEFAYRNPLFKRSITLQENLRDKYSENSSFYKYWKFMSYFGEAKITLSIFAIIFLFLPINSSFTLLLVIGFSSYITNLFKMLYRNKRPYWESEKLDIVCNSGYGNPSGHSLTSSSFYLTLAHLVTNFYFFYETKIGKIIKIIIFIFCCVWAFLIMCSRFMLAAHSLNQIIYGCTLGLGLYFLVIYILSYHTYDYKKFIQHVTKNIVIIIYGILSLILIVISIIVYFAMNEKKDLKNYLYENIFNGKRCSIKKKYKMLEHDGFFQSLAITSVPGSFFGILVLFILLKKNNYVLDGFIIEFNYSEWIRWFKRLPILIISAILILLYFLIPGKSNLAVIFIFKSALSFLLTPFCIYAFGVFFSIYFNCANENIAKIVSVK